MKNQSVSIQSSVSVPLHRIQQRNVKGDKPVFREENTKLQTPWKRHLQQKRIIHQILK